MARDGRVKSTSTGVFYRDKEGNNLLCDITSQCVSLHTVTFTVFSDGTKGHSGEKLGRKRRRMWARADGQPGLSLRSRPSAGPRHGTHRDADGSALVSRPGLAQESLPLIVVSVEVPSSVRIHKFCISLPSSTKTNQKHIPNPKAITHKFNLKRLHRLFPWIIYIQDTTALSRQDILLRSLRNNSNLCLMMHQCCNMLLC